MTADVQEMTADVQEMTANIKEIGIYSRETSSEWWPGTSTSREMTGNSPFLFIYA
jgi:hypothetical protein